MSGIFAANKVRIAVRCESHCDGTNLKALYLKESFNKNFLEFLWRQIDKNKDIVMLFIQKGDLSRVVFFT